MHNFKCRQICRKLDQAKAKLKSIELRSGRIVFRDLDAEEERNRDKKSAAEIWKKRVEGLGGANLFKEVGVCSGHFDHVTTLIYLPEYEKVASGSLDGTVKIWDLKTQKAILTFSFPSGHPTGLAISIDSRILISSSNLGAVVLWRFPASFKTRQSVQEERASRFYHTFKSLDEDDHLEDVWDYMDDGRIICSPEAQKLVHKKEITSICLVSQGLLVATGSKDKTVILSSFPNLQPVHTFDFAERVTHLCYLSGVDKLVVSSDDATLEIWNLQTKEREVTEVAFSLVTSLKAHPHNPRLFVTSGVDARIRTWTEVALQMKVCINGTEYQRRPVEAFAMSNDLLAAGDSSGTIRFYSRAGERLDHLEVKYDYGGCGQGFHPSEINFDPTDQILVVGGKGKFLKAW
eukprot:CAMPEP_0115025890 /NCGR_PEP_ID=MMETSP0216-20121206/34347_1 /TAXON_ID=223996 /ORGANISM="Protocruzia adherens, Strain Boccale" /LENGTH=403 /DNA_ID=CAMNT_0002400715 /DNA_START=48 /DNA_END=1256 /DNA_ORIENTATION=+